MDKIESLTPEQQEKLEVFRNEWLAVGLATGPANLDAVREPITAMYEELGYDAPAFVRCRSPLEAQLIINLLRGGLGEAREFHAGDDGPHFVQLFVYEPIYISWRE